MSKLIKGKFNIADVGLLEILLVLRDVLAPYNFLFLYMSYWLIPILLVLAFIRTKGKTVAYRNYAFAAMIAYVLIHDILLIFVIDDLPMHHLNSLLMTFVNLIGIYIVFPAIDFKKLINALIIVTPIICIGIIYHFVIILGGGSVHPIHIPLLEPVSERLSEEGFRPVSFFMEPSNFATFMMIPLFFSLYYKKIWYTVIIVFFMLLSTSTNGMLASALMVGTYGITQAKSVKRKAVYIGLIAVSALFVLNANVFELSRDKLGRTDIETDARTINGPILLKEMPAEHLIFGFPASNVNDYKDLNYINGSNLVALNDGTFYVSSQYLTIAKYGIIGYFLFILAFYEIYRKNKALIVLLLPLLVLKFSWSGCFNSSTFIWCVIMLSFTKFLNDNRTKRFVTKTN
jgi:hypothetical protein